MRSAGEVLYTQSIVRIGLLLVLVVKDSIIERRERTRTCLRDVFLLDNADMGRLNSRFQRPLNMILAWVSFRDGPAEITHRAHRLC
jgi:hypothetical protein